jgi:hypothetical protein
MTTGERLKAMRINAGYCTTKELEQFAKEIGNGYRASIIYNIESGYRKVGLKVIGKWCKVCKQEKFISNFIK